MLNMVLSILNITLTSQLCCHMILKPQRISKLHPLFHIFAQFTFVFGYGKGNFEYNLMILIDKTKHHGNN